MNQENQIFYHVGLGKTGTTFLQDKVFNHFMGINYIKRTKYRAGKWIKLIAKSKDRVHFMSNEFDNQLQRESLKIAETYPNAKIIMVLRRHDGWMASQYRRFIKNGNHLTFKEFIDVEGDAGFWKQEQVYFYSKVKFVEELFGTKPLLLFYEDFRNDPIPFVQKIADFMGATFDPNKVDWAPKHSSYSEKQLKYMRSISKGLFKKHVTDGLPYWLKKIDRFARMSLRYFTLFLGKVLPEKDKAPLISKEELNQLKDFYKEDWEKCKAYTLHN